MRTFAEHASCSGCSLCLLVCPVWHQRGDIRLTPHGRAKAQQHGAAPHELAASAAACTLCMSCEPICPEKLPLVDMILELRARVPLSPQRIGAMMDAAAAREPLQSLRERPVLLAGEALSLDFARLERARRMLGWHFVCAEDDGRDIALALEAGVPVPESRLLRFLSPLRTARELVVAEGLLLRALREWLPGMTCRSLGEALSRAPGVRARLRATDLYVIETRAFHADHERLIGHYDALRAELGCAMNLDLQRIGIPTTAAAVQHALGLQAVEVERQTRWILEGLRVERIVVEDVHDLAAFAGAGTPVLHLADLA
ncbi:MAG: 4Fe-4S dicluster domain-containing protein [Betaproteobacteria bacterium]